ncbi:hypothetical protein GCM10011409_34110 [Lentibacillus populi]|uniref:DUF5683 domain-containing protein n=1 Tax=Lentibacillus populi TaxID=1827502 RepID=A0A9W5U016_9BACI|nr:MULTISPECIES: hypothetical protein [Bacillaceae]GGB53661.1 hypothetical protein GCM10011409_34110 [Lentibacillus populi]
MKNKNTYKSPIAAMLWSLALPGFGQLYNGDFLLGIILMVWEVILNLQSHLNLGIMYTFKGDFEKVDQLLNFEWGLFYPSVFSFSLWQAYNRAKAINHRHQYNKELKRVYLTGFFIGLVTGMNMGINWHEGFLSTISPIFETPVFSGIVYGLTCAFVGHLLELGFKRFRRSD